jgi:hypothetical protein
MENEWDKNRRLAKAMADEMNPYATTNLGVYMNHLNDRERQQREHAQLLAAAQQPSYSSGGSGGGGSSFLVAVINACADFLTVKIGTKAYHNHMLLSNDPGYSAWQAAVAARRWRTWFWFCLVWVMIRIFGLWMLYLSSRMTDYTGSMSGWTRSPILSIIPQTMILGIFFCRNTDAALFKRGLVYGLFAPLRRLTERVNAGWLWAAFILSNFILAV